MVVELDPSADGPRELLGGSRHSDRDDLAHAVLHSGGAFLPTRAESRIYHAAYNDDFMLGASPRHLGPALDMGAIRPPAERPGDGL